MIFYQFIMLIIGPSFLIIFIYQTRNNMSITLNSPYVALPRKRVKYSSHYGITSETFLIVPIKDYGTDVSCEVRWEDGNGELHVREHMVFSKENLVKLNGMLDDKPQELWVHYYEDPKAVIAASHVERSTAGICN